MRTPKPPASFWLARLVRVTVGVVVPAAFRTRVSGRENVPGGGVVLAGNHVSYADPALLWCKSPRPAHFMAKTELWEIGWLGWCLDHLWTFPVNRDVADRQALSKASALLKAGEIVGVFPEGTRALDGPVAPHGGAAFLAIHNNVPVVPVGIAGTDRIMPAGSHVPHFPRTAIRFGRPIEPGEFTEGGHKERVEAMTGEIMRRIAEELETAREEV